MADKKDEVDLDKKLSEAMDEYHRRDLHANELVEGLQDRHNRAHEAYLNVIRDKKTGLLKHGILFNNEKKFDEAYKKLLEAYVMNFAASMGIDAKNVVGLLKTYKPGKHSAEHTPLEELVHQASGMTATQWYTMLKTYADKKEVYSHERHWGHIKEGKHVEKHHDRWKGAAQQPLMEYLRLEGSPESVYKLTGEKKPGRGKKGHTYEDLFKIIDKYTDTTKGKPIYEKARDAYYKTHLPAKK